MSDQDLSEGQLKAIDVIQKLLDKAASTDSAPESAALAAKAQELLAKHNLSSETLEGARDVKEGKREESKVVGGTYAFQRELWTAVAELNFCIYWNQKFRTEEKVRQNVYKENPDDPWGPKVYAGKTYVQVHRRRHALIGRIVNTRMTAAMATYLESAIERLLTERVGQGDVQRHSNWAWSYRRGMAADICDRLKERRRTAIRAERRAAERAAEEKKGLKEASSGTALTLSSFTKSEHDANMDFKYGEGYSTELAASRAKQAALDEEMEAAYTAWAKANPKEARSKFEFEKDGKTYSYGRESYGRGGGGGRDNIDYSAYKAGREAGSRIGLDPQAGSRAKQDRISGKKDIYA